MIKVWREREEFAKKGDKEERGVGYKKGRKQKYEERGKMAEKV